MTLPEYLQDKKVALSLPGGGAKGAFQAGVWGTLEEAGIRADLIAGISVGALNGAMIANRKTDRLVQLWKRIEKKDIAHQRGLLLLAWQYLKYKLGLGRAPAATHDNSPLHELLQQEVNMDDFQTMLLVGTVELESGQYHSYKYVVGRYIQNGTHHSTARYPDSQLLAPIVASTAVPTIFDPVAVDGKLHVDGGLRNINPMADLIAYEPDVIVVIPTEQIGSKPGSVGSQIDIIEAAKRTVEILLNEVFMSDLRECRRINDLVLSAQKQGATLKDNKGFPYKYYELIILEPEFGLGDMMNFERPVLDGRFEHGRQVATRLLEEFNRP